MKKIILTPFLFFFLTVSAQKEHYLLLGTYTGGKSEGIYVYKFNSENADNSFVSAAKTSNPSYLAVTSNGKFVYAVNEEQDNINYPDNGSVTAFSFDHATGTLSEINSQSSAGKDPCYVTTDATGKWLFVGNYSSGSISLYPLNTEYGTILEIKQSLQHNGSGPDTARQKAAHVHATVLSKDQRFLFVPDLGIDKVMVYEFDSKKGKLKAAKIPFAASKPGSGPRHFEFDPKSRYAYLMEELTGTVVVYEFINSALKPVQRISSLPDGFNGKVGSADIHVSPDGNFLYCSNRGGSNDISIFRINRQNGKLNLTGRQPTMGFKPRNFNFDPSGKFLLVANQDSDEVVIFSINKQTGLLTDTNKRIKIPSPVCIKWIR